MSKSVSMGAILKAVNEDIKNLDKNNIDGESSRTPTLHDKYTRLLYYEKVELESMKLAMKVLYRKLTEYYSGKADPEEYKKKPFAIKLKKDIDLYIESDETYIAAQQQVILQTEKVEYLKGIVNQINSRSFHLNNMLNYQRFKHGADKLGDHNYMDND